MTERQLKEKIRTLLTEQQIITENAEKLSDDSNIIEEFKCDSVGIMSLVVALEEEFGIRFSIDDLKIEHISSINGICST